MTEQVPVSVVIPCYNCTDTITRTIESVLAQTVAPAEIICIDDCSADNSVTILNNLQKKYKFIKIIQLEENKGPSIARNIGWDVSAEEYIAFLDADDIWHPRKLEIQYNMMCDNKDLILMGHQCPVFKKSFLELPSNIKMHLVSVLDLIISNRFITPTVMLRREIPYRFVENKDYAEDYLLWLQIVMSGNKSAYISAPLAYILKLPYGDGGLTKNLSALDKGIRDTFWRLYKEKRISFFIAVILQIYGKLKHYRRVFKVRYKML